MLLAEMLREAERVVDRQVESLRALDAKTEQVLGMGVALVGAEVAGAGYLQGAGDGWSVGDSFLIGAIALAFAGLAVLLDVYVGVRRSSVWLMGPDVAWLSREANDPRWRSVEHYVHVIAALERSHRANGRTLERQSFLRRTAVVLLLVSAFLAAGGAFYLLA